MREAVRRLVDDGHVDHIDLNFGCPVRKVTRHGGGSALPLKPRLLGRGHRRHRRRGRCRAGHRQGAQGHRRRPARPTSTPAAIADDAGRGRHRPARPHRGPALLGPGRLVGHRPAQAAVLPSRCWATATSGRPPTPSRMLRETGADGVVVGRGCLGRPWMFRDLVDVFEGRPGPTAPAGRGRRRPRRARPPAGRAVAGEHAGLRDLRKHTGWYLTGYPVGGDVRRALLGGRHARRARAPSSPTSTRRSRRSPDARRPPRGTQAGPQQVTLPDGWLDHRDDLTPPPALADAPGLRRLTPDEPPCRPCRGPAGRRSSRRRPHLVLASGSPRRRELLAGLGVALHGPGARRRRDARARRGPGRPTSSAWPGLKATVAAMPTAQPGEIVLAADTTVALAGAILGKPTDAADAAVMLRALSGRTHQVHTGVAVAGPRRRRRQLGHHHRGDLPRPDAATRSPTTWPPAIRSTRPAPTASRARPAAFVARLDGQPQQRRRPAHGPDRGPARRRRPRHRHLGPTPPPLIADAANLSPSRRPTATNRVTGRAMTTGGDAAGSVAEVALAGEDHGQAGLVGRGDDLVVAGSSRRAGSPWPRRRRWPRRARRGTGRTRRWRRRRPTARPAAFSPASAPASRRFC